MIIFNERNFAVDITNTPNKKSYSLYELTVYCKWLRWSIFHRKSDEEVRELVKTTLITFCKFCWDGFDEDVEYSRIDKAVERCLVEKLRTCNSVYISNNEWNIIMALEDEEASKILFTMLVLAKYGRANPIININKEKIEFQDDRLRMNLPLNEIYRYAKVRLKKDVDKYRIWGIYGQKGLVELIDGKTIKRILNFADVEVAKEDVFLEVKDFDNLIGYYNMQFNNKIKSCSRCSEVFKDSSKYNNLMICSKCKKKETEEKQRVIICEDCGERVMVKNSATKTTRCKACQNLISKEKIKQKNHKYYKKTN